METSACSEPHEVKGGGKADGAIECRTKVFRDNLHCV
jgi:hypothetical protein